MWKRMFGTQPKFSLFHKGLLQGQKFRDIKDDISYLEWLVSIDKISIEDFELLSTI